MTGHQPIREQYFLGVVVEGGEECSVHLSHHHVYCTCNLFSIGRDLWNEGKRFEDLPLSPGDKIMYAGGNTEGVDGVLFLNQCPQW